MHLVNPFQGTAKAYIAPRTTNLQTTHVFRLYH
jgi:hypothetical protein